MKRKSLLFANTIGAIGAIGIAVSFSAAAQFIVPAANLVIEGIPPISVELAKKAETYTEFKPSNIVAWHPTKPVALIRTRLDNTQQLHLLSKPGEIPVPITDFPDGISDASFQPTTGEYILFVRGVGGNEVFRIFSMDLTTKEITAISPDNERASTPSWNRKGDRIVFTTTSIDRFNRGEGAARTATTKLYIADPLKPAQAKLIATLEGGRWFGFRFSPDGKRLVFMEYFSANKSHIWQMTIATGKKTRVTHERQNIKSGKAVIANAVSYDQPHYTRDGKGLFVISDRGSEYRRLAYIDLASGKETVLTSHLHFDVDSFSVSVAARRISFITNEAGSSVLRFLDLDSKKELLRPALLSGVIAGLRWKNAREDNATSTAEDNLLGFNLASAKSPGEVFSYDVKTTKMTRWTNGSAIGLNPLEFVDPTLIQWKSFDGLTISGFRYQPDAIKFPGKRPVILSIHGGPEGQARPGFLARNS
ncbi:MAG: hypothetical protein WCL29_06305, partial [Pseudomonadota bacterium]